jgi:hypothetical protein
MDDHDQNDERADGATERTVSVARLELEAQLVTSWTVAAYHISNCGLWSRWARWKSMQMVTVIEMKTTLPARLCRSRVPVVPGVWPQHFALVSFFSGRRRPGVDDLPGALQHLVEAVVVSCS